MAGPTDHEIIVYKFAGALIGSLIALVYIKPVNVRDAISRTFVSVTCGYIFSFWVRDYFEWELTLEKVMASAVLSSFLSWFIAGAIILAFQAKIGKK